MINTCPKTCCGTDSTCSTRQLTPRQLSAAAWPGAEAVCSVQHAWQCPQLVVPALRRQAGFCLLALCLLVPMDAMLVASSMQTAAAGALRQWMVCS